ncbi:MAG: hypothetical protein ACREMO_11060 [Gemmatimonadales bacterium]
MTSLASAVSLPRPLRQAPAGLLAGILRTLVVAVIFLLPFHPLLVFLVGSSPLIHWKEALIALSCLVAVFGALLGRLSSSRLRRTPLALLGLFLGVVACSALGRGDLIAVFGAGGYTVYLCLYLVIVLSFRDLRPGLLIFLLLTPGVIIALGAIVQIVRDPTLWGLVTLVVLGGTDLIRTGSILGSAIVLAPYLTILVVLGLAATVAARRWTTRLPALGATLVLSVALGTTWSRGGWLQLLLALVILGGLVWWGGGTRALAPVRRRLLIGGVIVLVALSLWLTREGASGVLENLKARTVAALNWSTEEANLERRRAWIANLQFLAESPVRVLVGAGPGEGWTFELPSRGTISPYEAWMLRRGLPPVTESFFLLLLLNLGVLGLGLFCAIYLSILRRGFRLLRRLEDPFEYTATAAVVAGLLALFVAQLWFQSLTSIFVSMILWVQFAYLSLLEPTAGSRRADPADRAG